MFFFKFIVQYIKQVTIVSIRSKNVWLLKVTVSLRKQQCLWEPVEGELTFTADSTTAELAWASRGVTRSQILQQWSSHTSQSDIFKTNVSFNHREMWHVLLYSIKSSKFYVWLCRYICDGYSNLRYLLAWAAYSSYYQHIHSIIIPHHWQFLLFRPPPSHTPVITARSGLHILCILGQDSSQSDNWHPIGWTVVVTCSLRRPRCGSTDLWKA